MGTPSWIADQYAWRAVGIPYRKIEVRRQYNTIAHRDVHRRIGLITHTVRDSNDNSKKQQNKKYIFGDKYSLQTKGKLQDYYKVKEKLGVYVKKKENNKKKMCI